MDPSTKVETPIIELPHDENKLFDEEDDVGTSTIPDLSLPSEDEEEEIMSSNVCKYTIDVLFKLSPLHAEGKSLRKWVKHQDTDNTQSVCREFESHMSASSKGLNERHRLHAYVSTTVYDKSWKGTTEQFVIHFHEQLRQLDEVTPLNEHLPHSVRLTLLQTAVRSVPELRIVETMEEYMSLTQSSTGQYSLTYDKYFMMLQNACIRYDKTLKHKPSAVYQHEVEDDPGIHDEEDDYLDDNFAPDGIDTHSDDVYNVHNTNFKRTPHVESLIPRKPPGKSKPHKAMPPKPRYKGPVYVTKHIYNLLNEDIKKELVEFWGLPP